MSNIANLARVTPFASDIRFNAAKFDKAGETMHAWG